MTKYPAEWNQTFIQMAQLMAQRSRCTKHQVACIITKDRRPIITGINGTPPGYLNCDEKFDDIPTNTKSEEYKLYADDHHQWSNHNEQHAEQNAVAFSAKYGIPILDTVVYLTMTPCVDCAKLLAVSGIQELHYHETYDRYPTEGIEFLESNHIPCFQTLP